MKRKNVTRNALFTSIISLLLCVSMLVGTTFAWFTDEVTSGTNTIAAGNLDVELYNEDGRVTGNTKLFDDVVPNLWEPGALAYENFEVVNEGTLALKYNMSLDVVDETVVDGNMLSDVIMVGVKAGGFTSTTRQGVIDEVGNNWVSLSRFVLDMNGKSLSAGASEAFGVVLYWAPNADSIDNLYNVKNEALKLTVGVTLVATQLDAESDSFGPDYDEGLDPATTYVFDAEGLRKAVENGGNVVLSADIVIPAADFTQGDPATPVVSIPVGLLINSRNPVTIDLNGKTISAEETGVQTALIHVLNTDVTIKGNGNFVQNGTDDDYIIWAKGNSTVNIEGGNFVANDPDNILLYASNDGTNNAQINVHGGKFSTSATDPQHFANVRNFHLGKIAFYGGTFSFNPDWNVLGQTSGDARDDAQDITIANGYKATEVDGLYYITAETTDVVSNETALTEAINKGTTEIMLTSGAYTIPSAAKGKELTIVGNGESVINITKAGGEGANGNLDGSKVVFENVVINTDSKTYTGWARMNATYNNCTINGTYTLYGDSVFNNCTFNVSGDVYNIWTWGAPTATFNNCTFNSDGKAMLLYGTVNTKLTLNGCTFNDKGGLTDLKAAVEIGNDYNKSYELIVNNTTVNGYEINDKGIITGTTLWGNKNSMSGEKLKVTVDGVAQAWDAVGVANALTSDAKNISVELVNDVEVPITSLGTITGGSGEYKLGGDNTESITIDLNGKKLNITTTYWSNIGAKNDAALFTIKNGSMTSSQATGTWNSYDITFSNCDYVIENVVFDKAIAFDNAGKSVKLNDITVNETHDYYAIWICAAGMDVEIDGLTVNSAGRGIKIDEQYVGAPEKVTLKVANATFTTVKKAAIMVKSAAGADIILNNVNISNVAADSTNVVWVDADAAAHASKVIVSGGSVITES